MNIGKDSNTERIGVFETALIITKELKWVFREQTVVDVGIDALIEQSIDGIPKGKFIATQIKTGEGNFNVTSNYLTYYVSKIHYNYWLNLNLPIIIVAHLPKSDITIWEVINKTNLIKTKKKWKIDILKEKRLNKDSIFELIELINNFNQDDFISDLKTENISTSQIKSIESETKSTNKARISIVKINKLITELGIESNKYTKLFDSYIDLGLIDSDKRVKRSIKNYSEFLNRITNKIDVEIDNFAYHYSIGIRAQEKLTIINLYKNKDYNTTQEVYDSIVNLEPSIQSAINGTKSLRNSISSLPNKYSHLRKAKNRFIDTVNELINELKEANKMNIIFINNLDKYLG